MTTAPTVEAIAHHLAGSRERMLGLLAPFDEDTLTEQVSPIMSPLLWDLGHVGNYEELWLVRAIDGRRPIDGRLDDLYNAFEHPRWTRPDLPVLAPAEARSYLDRVRASALDLLAELFAGGDLAPDAERPLTAGGFVHGMVVQHEHQHAETVLATRQLMGADGVPLADVAPSRRGGPVPHAEVRVDGGRFPMGTCDPWAYDNERPEHEVDVTPFWLDAAPVTCGAYQDFVEAGGYDERYAWSEAGWQWRTEHSVDHPMAWLRTRDGWAVERFSTVRPLRDDEPVQHVSFHEAEAFARWAGRRLPTEPEWEMAATWHPSRGKTAWPWGDQPPTPALANLGQRHDGPSPVGAHPDGTSPWGAHQMVGDVWEWTNTPFARYPGFRSFPYAEYSEVFFGNEYQVLRGGSWATHPSAIRGTFRNWDYPIRRQIFAGFRTARDAGGA